MPYMKKVRERAVDYLEDEAGQCRTSLNTPGVDQHQTHATFSYRLRLFHRTQDQGLGISHR